jgi:hypothetical protein
MKTKIYALVIAAVGILLGWLGISTLVYQQSFTATTEGVVSSRDDHYVQIQFEEHRPPQDRPKAIALHFFPVDRHSETWRVGDKVTVYHPPGRLAEACLVHDFHYLAPVLSAAAGVAIAIAAGIMAVTGPRSSEGATSLESSRSSRTEP